MPFNERIYFSDTALESSDDSTQDFFVSDSSNLPMFFRDVDLVPQYSNRNFSSGTSYDTVRSSYIRHRNRNRTRSYSSNNIRKQATIIQNWYRKIKSHRKEHVGR